MTFSSVHALRNQLGARFSTAPLLAEWPGPDIVSQVSGGKRMVLSGIWHCSQMYPGSWMGDEGAVFIFVGKDPNRLSMALRTTWRTSMYIFFVGSGEEKSAKFVADGFLML